jgi:5-(carboxyamino)imidazole ribonucleotide synthase
MRVGIFGGGQLATMLAEAILRLGATPRVYDPDVDAPARARVADFVAAPFDDAAALHDFTAGCDVLTYEREDLPVGALRDAAGDKPWVPDLGILEVAQDRALEKAFLARYGLGPVRHVVVPPDGRLDEAAAAFGLPAIAKTTRGGYDGKGQFFIARGADAAAAQAAIPTATWVLEEPIDIVAEASCIVARAGTDEVTFPVVENLHRDHILDRSVVPCRLATDVVADIRDRALTAARALDARGLLAVEFFVAGGGSAEPARVLINELAPRPHNSGHLLSRACTFGQFDALARILTGAPIGVPRELPGAFCMGNLLGDVWISQRREGPLDLTAWRGFPDVVDVHLYGKRQAALRRKMGHFVVQSTSADDALARADAFRTALARTSRPS